MSTGNRAILLNLLRRDVILLPTRIGMHGCTNFIPLASSLNSNNCVSNCVIDSIALGNTDPLSTIVSDCQACCNICANTGGDCNRACAIGGSGGGVDEITQILEAILRMGLTANAVRDPNINISNIQILNFDPAILNALAASTGRSITISLVLDNAVSLDVYTVERFIAEYYVCNETLTYIQSSSISTASLEIKIDR
jgi:hypothetical protein